MTQPYAPTLVLASILLIFFAFEASSHEVRPAYLGLTEISEGVFDVVWKQPRKNAGSLPLQVALPDICVKTTAVGKKPLANAVIQTWQVHCDGSALPTQTIAIDGLTRSLADVWVSVERLQTNQNLAAVLSAAEPAVTWQSDKRIALGSYFSLGARHLLSGLDHILLIVGLMFFVKGLPALVRTITAFTIAHSLTLAASSLNLVDLSTHPVEATISLSILYLAYEASSPDKDSTLTARAPWLVAFICGLLHGLGFAGALNETGLPTGYATEALLLFNLGIEFGQIAVLCVILLFVRPLSNWTTRRAVWLNPVPAYVMGALSSYWLLQRLVATAGWGDSL